MDIFVPIAVVVTMAIMGFTGVQEKSRWRAWVFVVGFPLLFFLSAVIVIATTYRVGGFALMAMSAIFGPAEIRSALKFLRS